MEKIGEYEKCGCGRPGWNRINLYNTKEDFKNNNPVKTIYSCPFCLLEKSTFAVIDAQKQGNLKTLEAIMDIEVPTELKERIRRSPTVQRIYKIMADTFPRMLGYSENVAGVKVDISDKKEVDFCCGITFRPERIEAEVTIRNNFTSPVHP